MLTVKLSILITIASTIISLTKLVSIIGRQATNILYLINHQTMPNEESSYNPITRQIDETIEETPSFAEYFNSLMGYEVFKTPRQ